MRKRGCGVDCRRRPWLCIETALLLWTVYRHVFGGVQAAVDYVPHPIFAVFYIQQEYFEVFTKYLSCTAVIHRWTHML